MLSGGSVGSDCEVSLRWTESTDDLDPQFVIEYEVYVNGVEDHSPALRHTRTSVYANQNGLNTFAVAAVDSAGNRSELSRDRRNVPRLRLLGQALTHGAVPGDADLVRRHASGLQLAETLAGSAAWRSLAITSSSMCQASTILPSAMHMDVLIHRHVIALGDQQDDVDHLVGEGAGPDLQAGQVVVPTQGLAAGVPDQPRRQETERG